ncbi:hypothetical protein [Photobacterium sp. J15]|uniref:hypothetical protein n=1 Tax=Photobacterium sp. J15 TaxID=265901 RepID=UPI0007E3233D|nr:hypothetical protein [Photobacterium sp. J15]
MQKCQQIRQAASWIELLSTMKARPKLVGILQSSPPLAKQLLTYCHVKGLSSFGKANRINTQLMAETIAASACDSLICDREHYETLFHVLHHHPQKMTVILNQEIKLPDWCCQFHNHNFLCQQDLD